MLVIDLILLIYCDCNILEKYKIKYSVNQGEKFYKFLS